MLTAIVRFSLRFRGVIVALACLSVGYGFYALSQSKYDVFPEFAPPQVTIQTEAPGLAPEQVELLVTQPIENALNGISGIESLRSESILGLSVITVTFITGSDVFADRQLVAGPLAEAASELPAGVSPPVISPLTSSTSTVLVAGLTSETHSLMELRTMAAYTLQPRLLAVPGVAKVTVFGGEKKQIQVQVRPDQLIAYGLGMDDVLAAAERATGVRGGGFIAGLDQVLVIQAEGQPATPESIARTVVVHAPGGNVTIGDLATVTVAPEPPAGAVLINRAPGVALNISAQYGQNTLEVSRRLEQALADFKPMLAEQKITLIANLFRPADFIESSVHNLMNSLLLGAVLVVAVLLLFLFNFRTAAISCTAIPLSLLAGVTMLERMGLSLNTMTLGGLAIAIGEVVDDAVIDVENILRRLRENRHSAAPRRDIEVVLAAAIEVRGAVVFATVSVALVFVPILTMSGVAGRLFAPLGTAYILSVLASLAVALTVTPALCLLLLNPRTLDKDEPPVVRRLKARYLGLLRRVEDHARAVMIAVVIFTLAGLATLPFLGGEFLPELREGNFIIHMSAAPGASLPESLRLGALVAKELHQVPAVNNLTQFAGRAELGDDVHGPHYSEIYTTLKPLAGADDEETLATLRQALTQFLGANFAINTFLTERVEETVSGYGSEVVINLYGSDLDALDERANAVSRVIGAMPAATNVTVQSPPGTPQLALKLKPRGLSRWGLDAVTVLEAVRTAYQGSVVGQVYEGNRVVEVVVVMDPAARQDPGRIRALTLRGPAGTYVPLSELADVYETAGRFVVLHDGARRVQAITCNVTGDAAAFVREAGARIQAEAPMPPGMYVSFSGTAEAEARSQRDLLLHSAFAGVGIVLLLWVVTGRARNLALLLVNLPFALVGGVLVVFAGGGGLSLGSMVGFVTLFGITLRNSIMMISHYEHLVSVEGKTWGVDTAIQGASERLAPILMTALVTGLGLLPLALGGEAAGREIEGPLALVILGGLVTSTSLNLLVLPTLALRFGRFGERG